MARTSTSRAIGSGLALCAALALLGCAASGGVNGYALRGAEVSTGLQTLAARSRQGDKAAQLALGIAYEVGTAVPADAKRALTLYRLAGATSGGTIYVYVPAAKKGGRGYTTPVNLGPIVPGLPEAKARAAALKARLKQERAARK